MRQILHIFVKDVRHLWIEILLSIAITCCFAWVYPKQWWQGVGSEPFRGQIQPLANLLTTLVPLSWWLLIARSVQAETLVGDRQFWITRPYERGKLLAAKALFVLSFIYAPIIAAQCSLLSQAGFPPLHYLNDSLYSLLLMSAVLVFPVLAIAAVTANLVRMTLTVLCIVLIAIATITATLAYRFNSGGTPSSFSVTDPLIVPAVLFICAAVIALQYFARRTALSRLILFAIPLAFVLFGTIYSSAALINRAYPGGAAATDVPITSAYVENSKSVTSFPNPRMVWTRLPLDGSGIAKDDVWFVDAVKVELETAHNQKWDLPWQQDFGVYRAGERDASIGFEISRSVYDQLNSQPVTLHLKLALKQARPANIWQSTWSDHDLVVPHFGVCSGRTFANDMVCRFPFREPSLTYVETWWTDGPCGTPGATSSNRVMGVGWIGSEPWLLGISSVQERGIQISNGPGNTDEAKFRHRCPGDPVTVTRYGVVRHVQTELTVHDFQFPSLKAAQ